MHVAEHRNAKHKTPDPGQQKQQQTHNPKIHSTRLPTTYLRVAEALARGMEESVAAKRENEDDTLVDAEAPGGTPWHNIEYHCGG